MRQAHRVLIVDDHAIMRDGVSALLATDKQFEVVGMAADGMEAFRKAASLKPDIVLMDVSMPKMNGIEIIRRLKRKLPDVRVIVLTFHDEERFIQDSLQAGAIAYVLKNDSRRELFAALQNATNGKNYLSPSICDKVVAGYLSGHAPAAGPTVGSLLTSRERQVMKLIAEGFRTKEIADYLALSPKTIDKHRSNLMKKLNLHSVSAVTAYAIANDIWKA